MYITDSPDWLRLQKALAIEAERGFVDLMGKQYRFSEFLSLSFGKSPDGLPFEERQRWQSMALEFANYPQLTLEERQSLVATTRRYIYNTFQATPGEEQPYTPKVKLAKTTPLAAEINERLLPTLDQSFTSLPEIGARRASYLTRLGLSTVRDVLFYYPRDHIDYARQVNIRELAEGETVTIVGRVHRCSCFSSPRNPKLTILEVILKEE